MTKRERVIAALAGREVDRGPTRLLMHNFARENSARRLAAQTLRLARTFDWDYLKPRSRAQCFAEMWGLTYGPSTERATRTRLGDIRRGAPPTSRALRRWREGLVVLRQGRHGGVGLRHPALA